MDAPPHTIYQANTGIDGGFGGQIEAESGIIGNLEGFDSLELTVLYIELGSAPGMGTTHPVFTTMYLVNKSPRRVEAGRWSVTLTYQGAGPGRPIRGSAPQALTDPGVMWDTSTINGSDRTWTPGSIEGTVGGLNLKNRFVRLNFPAEVITAHFLCSKFLRNVETLSQSMGSFIGTPRNPYANLKTRYKDLITNTVISGNPVINFPAGYVPHIQKCKQIYPGITTLYDCTISYMETPKESY